MVAEKAVGLIIAILIVFLSVALAPDFFGEKESSRYSPPPLRSPEKTGESYSETKREVSQTPALKKENDPHKEFNQFMIDGLKALEDEQFYRASYLFHQAEALDPKSAAVKYHLMLSYKNLERNPYEADSMTVRYAVELLSLQPTPYFKQEAELILKRHEKLSQLNKTRDEIAKDIETGEKKHPDKREDYAELASARVQRRKLPSLPGDPGYPTAEPGEDKNKAPEKTRTAKTAAANEEIDKKASTVTLVGKITRPNEKGVFINPGGVELKLISITGSESYTTVSDTRGRYEFKGVKPGYNYALAAVSEYSYYRYVREYYPLRRGRRYRRSYPYSYYHPYNRSTSYYSYQSTTGSLNVETTYEEDRTSTSVGIGPFSNRSTRISTGDGYIYYAPSYPTGYVGDAYNPYDSYYPYYQYTRPVELDYNMSWHFRMNLKEPGKYKLDLGPDNADENFSDEMVPHYNPVTHELFDEITDVSPIPVSY